VRRCGVEETLYAADMSDDGTNDHPWHVVDKLDDMTRDHMHWMQETEVAGGSSIDQDDRQLTPMDRHGFHFRRVAFGARRAAARG
jgi:hypothetical protein